MTWHAIWYGRHAQVELAAGLAHPDVALPAPAAPVQRHAAGEDQVYHHRHVIPQDRRVIGWDHHVIGWDVMNAPSWDGVWMMKRGSERVFNDVAGIGVICPAPPLYWLDEPDGANVCGYNMSKLFGCLS